MAVRTVSGGIETYRRASDGQWAYGVHGEEVDVHEDDVDRFDRLAFVAPDANVPEVAAPEDDEPAFPEGDPSEEWSGKQLDAYAAAKSIELGSAKTKAEKVAAIVAASAPAE